MSADKSSSRAFGRAADFWHELPRFVADIGRHHAATVEQVQSVAFSYLYIAMPNKSPEPTAVGAGRSAVAVHAASRRWLSFFR